MKMQMKWKSKLLITVLLASLTLLTACGQSAGQPTATDPTAAPSSSGDAAEKKKIKFGISGSSEVPFTAAAEGFKELGYEVEAVVFDSVLIAQRALNDGSVDMILSGQKRFMENFNKENGGDLHMMEPYLYHTRIGLYSEKHSSIDEFPKGAKIGIMNDAMNMDIGMRILSDAGLITLKGDDPDKIYSTLDVAENPKNIQLVEMDQGQSARSLEDLDASLVWFSSMHMAGKDVNSYLAYNTNGINYPVSPIVKEKDKDTQWAKDLTQCFHTQAVKDAVDKYFPHVYVFYSDNQ